MFGGVEDRGTGQRGKRKLSQPDPTIGQLSDKAKSATEGNGEVTEGVRNSLKVKWHGG